MKLIPVAISILCLGLALPAMAHERAGQRTPVIAQAIYCSNGDFEDEGYSRFVLQRRRTIYTGGITDWSNDESVGFRLDSAVPVRSFSFDSVSSGHAAPTVFYSYDLGGSSFLSINGVHLTPRPNNVTHWSFRKQDSLLPEGAKVTTIWFQDGGLGDFTNTVFNIEVNGGAARPVHGLDSDCTEYLP